MKTKITAAAILAIGASALILGAFVFVLAVSVEENANLRITAAASGAASGVGNSFWSTAQATTCEVAVKYLRYTGDGQFPVDSGEEYEPGEKIYKRVITGVGFTPKYVQIIGVDMIPRAFADDRMNFGGIRYDEMLPGYRHVVPGERLRIETDGFSVQEMSDLNGDGMPYAVICYR